MISSRLFTRHLPPPLIGRRVPWTRPCRFYAAGTSSSNAVDEGTGTNKLDKKPEEEEDLLAMKDDDYDSLSEEDQFKRYRQVYFVGKSFKESWSLIWNFRVTPFDLKQANPVLQPALEKKGMKFQNILVPGCGSGHDLLVLAKFNPDSRVTGVDISQMALHRADDVAIKAYQAKEIPESDIELVLGDFLDDGKWEVQYQHTPRPPKNNKEEKDRDYTPDDDEMSAGKSAVNDIDSKKEARDSSEATTETGGTSKLGGTIDEKAPNSFDNISKDPSSIQPSFAKESPETSEQEPSANTSKGREKTTSNAGDEHSNDLFVKMDTGLDEKDNKAADDSTDEEGAKDDFTEEEDAKSADEEDGPKVIGFDLIYDHGFFNALPVFMRKAYAQRLVALANPDRGRVLTIMYPIDDVGCVDRRDGPPFHATVKDYKDLFEPIGLIMEDEPYESPHSIPSRKGKELICWWRLGEPVLEQKPKRKKKDDWSDSDSDSE